MKRVTKRRRLPIVVALVVITSTLSQTGVSLAGHGAFTTSAAIYRVPYADGLTVTANNDHHNHPNAPNRVDMAVGEGNVLVAAASGIIRGIVDFNGDDYGRGDGLASDGVTPQDDALEDNCSGDGDNPVGSCSDYNNYVWIEHPNGEWTKYSHPETGSVTIDFGWSVGDTILVGQPLGFEGKVGAANGSHLHFEVAAVPPGSGTTPFSTLGGFVPSGWNVVAQVCFVDGDDNGDGLYTDGESYTAGECTNTAPTAQAGGPYVVDEGSDVQLDGTGSSDPENAILSYSWAPSTNLDDATIATPTYSGVDDTVDLLTLTVSDVGGDVSAAEALTDDDPTTVTVNNVAPEITSLSAPMIDEDGSVNLSGDFTDVGTEDTHTVSVDWGDGSSGPAVVVQGAGSGTFAATHQYLDDDPTGTPQDTYTITVTVTDDDTGSDEQAIDTLVKNVAPEITSVVSDATFEDKAEEGEIVTVSGAFTDVGTLDTHTAVVDWGDGNVDPATVTQGSGSGTFTAGHAYTAGGVYNVTVTVTDDDTGIDSDTTLAVVSGVGLNAGVLQIVGTAGKDHVEVFTAGGEVDVFASFVSPHHRRFDPTDVDSIEIWLCEGNDHADVHQSIAVDATIHGDAGADMLWGGGGADFIEGGDGNDKIWGRNGDDALYGDAGNDRLTGGQGTDLLDGGPGADKLKQ